MNGRSMDISDSPVVLSRGEIERVTKRVAREILQWLYPDAGSTGAELTIICILNGAWPFTKSLIDELLSIKPDIVLDVSCIKVEATRDTTILEERKLLQGSFEPGGMKNMILIVDDLLDTGKTIGYVYEKLAGSGRDVKSCVLVKKFRDIPFAADFVGHDLAWERREDEDFWLFGYGMDLNGSFRDLDFISYKRVKKISLPLEED